MKRIYADSAATTPLCAAAAKAMSEYYELGGGNPSGLYAEARTAKDALERSRAVIAEWIGAKPSEIIFTSGGTEADNAAIRTAVEPNRSGDKFHIVASPIEHHAVTKPLGSLYEEGFYVDRCGVGNDGVVSADDVARAIQPETFLVSVMTANNEIGTVQPVEEIGELCRSRGVLFHTDAVQAVGHIPIDVRKIKCDFLAASAHKFGGPTGIGFLYVRDGCVEHVYGTPVGGGQERGRRAGTENVAGAVGMAAALDHAMTYCKTTGYLVTTLRDRLIDGILREVPGAVLNGDRERRLPGNANFCIEGVTGEPLVLLLDEAGISASSGSACTTGNTEGSHVLRAIGRTPEESRSALRLTISGDTTQADVDEIIRAVRDCAAKLRGMSKGG